MSEFAFLPKSAGIALFSFFSMLAGCTVNLNENSHGNDTSSAGDGGDAGGAETGANTGAGTEDAALSGSDTAPGGPTDTQSGSSEDVGTEIPASDTMPDTATPTGTDPMPSDTGPPGTGTDSGGKDTDSGSRHSETESATSTIIDIESPTATQTATVTNTQTGTETETTTVTATDTDTATVSETGTATETATVTATATATVTATATTTSTAVPDPYECQNAYSDAILCAGFEDGLGLQLEPDNDGTVTQTTDLAHWGDGSAYAEVGSGGSLAVALDTFSPMSSGTIYYRGYFYIPAGTFSADNDLLKVIEFEGSSVQTDINILGDGRVEIFSRDPVSRTDSAPGIISEGTWFCLSGQVVIADNPNGAATLDVDGASTLNVTGIDTLPAGDLSAVGYGVGWMEGLDAAEVYFDDVVVDDAPIPCL